jgi:hypothetical protein
VIYIVWAKGTDFIKVGYTADVTINSRLGDLQVGCPYPLEVVVFAEGSMQDEAQYHQMLVEAKAYVRGEWFKWCPTAHKISQMLKAQPKNILKAKARNPHRRLGAVLSLAVNS